MYATRDVTATVENLGLITASIVSKKLAAGLDHLVLDVKCGNGAVMQDPAEARLLAESMVAVGHGAGMNTSALLTDMSVPLAWSAGNAVEVDEAVSYLRNDGPSHPRLDEVVMSLGAKLLVQAEVHDTNASAQRQLRQVLDNGRALELFAQSVAQMGGDAAVAERPAQVLPQAAVVRPVVAPQAGTLTAYDVRQVGMAVVELGGGRSRPDAAIDPSVGLSQLPLVGTTFSRGDALVTVHAASEQAWEAAQQRLLGAMTFDGEVHLPDAVVGHVG
jgi:thymidine phosphorylase